MIASPLRSLLVSSLFALFAGSAMADGLKIGYINTERVVREAPAAISAGKKMEAEFGPRNQELKRLAADLEARRTALAENAAGFSETQRRAKESEIAELTVILQRKQREYQEDLSLRQAEENSMIIEKANAVIKRIAESEHLDLILQEAVAVSKNIDITDLVLKMLSNDK